jgi:hypothetical protein
MRNYTFIYLVFILSASFFSDTILATTTKHETLGSFFAQAPANIVVEDFDSIASGTLITNLSGIMSVTGFTTNPSPRSADVYVISENDMPFPMLSGHSTTSPPNLLAIHPYGTPHATGEITFEFESEQIALGFFVADGAPLGTFRIDIYMGNNLLDSVSSDTFKTLPDSFFGVTCDFTFDRAVFGSNNEDDSWGIDNLYYVPEPATICLLGLGALSLLRSSRRRSSCNQNRNIN